MKTLINFRRALIPFVLILSLISLESCESRALEPEVKQEQTISTKSSKEASLILQYDVIGAEHNKILEEVFVRLKDTVRLNTQIKGDAKQVKGIGISYLKDILRTNEALAEGEKLHGISIDKIVSDQVASFEKTGPAAGVAYASIKEKLSTNQRKVLDLLDNEMFYSKDKDPSIKWENIEKIEIQAIRILADSELPLVLTACAVAKYSYTFWNKNYDSINNELFTQIKTKQWEYWLWIAASDAVGAMMGALEYWYMAAIPGLYEVVIVASAVAASFMAS